MKRDYIYVNNVFIASLFDIDINDRKWTFDTNIPPELNLENYSNEQKQTLKNWCFFQSIKRNHQPLGTSTNIELDLPFNIVPVRNIEITHTTKKFDEIIENRVHELVKLSEKYNQKIGLFYSGGVDSTFMLYAFLKTLGIQKSTEIITIYLNKYSIIENINTYKKYIEPNFQIKSSDDISHLDFSELYLVAESAISLFSGLYTNNLNTAIDNLQYKDFYYCVKQIHDPRIDSDFAINLMQKSSQIQLNDNHDYFWWFFANFRPVGMIHNMFQMCVPHFNNPQFSQQYYDDHILGFFDNNEIYSWSYSNKDYMINAAKNHPYKKILKDYIFEYDNNSSYNKYKQKEAYISIMQQDKTMLPFLTRNYNSHD